MTLPFCPKCGREVSAEGSYCPSCSASSRQVDKDLLREKIADARHSEIGAVVLSIVGLAMVFVALFVSFITEKRYEWRGLTLYETTYYPYVDLAKIFWVLGMVIGVFSSIVGAYYWYQRRKLMKQLESLR